MPDWRQIYEPLLLACVAARNKTAVRFDQEADLEAEPSVLLEKYIAHASALAEELADIFIKASPEVVPVFPVGPDWFRSWTAWVIHVALDGFDGEWRIENDAIRFNQGRDLRAKVIIGREPDSERQAKLVLKWQRVLGSLLRRENARINLAVIDALKPATIEKGPKRPKPKLPRRPRNPEKDPNMVGLAMASFFYGIPRSMLSKAAKKKPGTFGYLRSRKRGRNRYFLRKDIEKWEKSRRKRKETPGNSG